MRISPLIFVKIVKNYVTHSTGHLTLAGAVESRFPGFLDAYRADPFIADRYDDVDEAVFASSEFFTNVLSFFCLPLPNSVIRNTLEYHTHLARVKELRAKLVLARRVAQNVLNEQVRAERVSQWEICRKDTQCC